MVSEQEWDNASREMRVKILRKTESAYGSDWADYGYFQLPPNLKDLLQRTSAPRSRTRPSDIEMPSVSTWRTNRRTQKKFPSRKMLETWSKTGGAGNEVVQLSLLRTDNRPDLQLLTDSQEVRDTLEGEGLADEDYDTLLVGQHEGEIYEIWGIHGVPYNDKYATLLLRRTSAFEHLGVRYPGSEEE